MRGSIMFYIIVAIFALALHIGLVLIPDPEEEC